MNVEDSNFVFVTTLVDLSKLTSVLVRVALLEIVEHGMLEM